MTLQLTHQTVDDCSLQYNLYLVNRQMLLLMQGVLSLKWGDRAKRLYVGAADHNLRIYQTSQPGV